MTHLPRSPFEIFADRLCALLNYACALGRAARKLERCGGHADAARRAGEMEIFVWWALSESLCQLAALDASAGPLPPGEAEMRARVIAFISCLVMLASLAQRLRARCARHVRPQSAPRLIRILSIHTAAVHTPARPSEHARASWYLPRAA